MTWTTWRPHASVRVAGTVASLSPSFSPIDVTGVCVWINKLFVRTIFTKRPATNRYRQRVPTAMPTAPTQFAPSRRARRTARDACILPRVRGCVPRFPYVLQRIMSTPTELFVVVNVKAFRDVKVASEALHFEATGFGLEMVLLIVHDSHNFVDPYWLS